MFSHTYTHIYCNNSCVFEKGNFLVLFRVLVCLRMCVCFWVCVFLLDNSKRNRSRNIKFKYIVVNENNLDKFNIRHCWTKVKVTTLKFFSILQYKFSGPITLVQTRKLIFSVYVYLIILYKFYKYRQLK